MMIPGDFLNLPDPTRDSMPLPVVLDDEGLAYVKSQKRQESMYLNPKNDTEARIKYLLEGRLFGATLRKDGDWVTAPGGREVYQKKISDFVGGITFPGEDHQRLLYVEVKGVSPGNNFALSRLDKPNRKGQPSQYEKLQRVHDEGAFVLVAIGWWNALPGKEPVIEHRKGRKYTRWLKKDLELTITLTRWDVWTGFVLPTIKEQMKNRRSIPNIHKHRSILFEQQKVWKRGNRWELELTHWWKYYGLDRTAFTY